MSDHKQAEDLSSAARRGEEILSIVGNLIEEISKGKDEIQALLAAGKIREIAQTYNLSRQIYTGILRKHPNAYEALARLALVELKIGNAVEGLTLAKQLVEHAAQYTFKDISGRPASSQTVLGDAYRSNNNLNGAITAYQAAIKLQPTDYYAVAKLAQIFVDHGKTEDAAELLNHTTGATELDSMRATMNLLTNDKNRLPALGGVMNDWAATFAMVR